MKLLVLLAGLLVASPAYAKITYDSAGVAHDDSDHSYLDPETGHWTTEPGYEDSMGGHYETDDEGNLHFVVDNCECQDGVVRGGDGNDTSDGMQNERGHGSSDGGRGPDKAK